MAAAEPNDANGIGRGNPTNNSTHPNRFMEVLLDKRSLIIEMLARHRAMGDEDRYRREIAVLGGMSTELLMCFLTEEQLGELGKEIP